MKLATSYLINFSFFYTNTLDIFLPKGFTRLAMNWLNVS
jgi:hypothetical protein